jgi:hypothetical protein
MLEKRGKKCFSFLWTGKKERERIPLIKWNKIAKPKEDGGWGFKNIYHFGQALASSTLGGY